MKWGRVEKCQRHVLPGELGGYRNDSAEKKKCKGLMLGDREVTGWERHTFSSISATGDYRGGFSKCNMQKTHGFALLYWAGWTAVGSPGS